METVHTKFDLRTSSPKQDPIIEKQLLKKADIRINRLTSLVVRDFNF